MLNALPVCRSSSWFVELDCMAYDRESWACDARPLIVCVYCKTIWSSLTHTMIWIANVRDMKCHVQTIWNPLPYLTVNHAEYVWCCPLTSSTCHMSWYLAWLILSTWNNIYLLPSLIVSYSTSISSIWVDVSNTCCAISQEIGRCDHFHSNAPVPVQYFWCSASIGYGGRGDLEMLKEVCKAVGSNFFSRMATAEGSA